MLCGSGFEWRECVNGEIPMSSVSISPKHMDMDPIFIARERRTGGILSTFMDGNVLCRPDLEIAEKMLSECEILVASNVKNRKLDLKYLYSKSSLQKKTICFSIQWKWGST